MEQIVQTWALEKTIIEIMLLEFDVADTRRTLTAEQKKLNTDNYKEQEQTIKQIQRLLDDQSKQLQRHKKEEQQLIAQIKGKGVTQEQINKWYPDRKKLLAYMNQIVDRMLREYEIAEIEERIGAFTKKGENRNSTSAIREDNPAVVKLNALLGKQQDVLKAKSEEEKSCKKRAGLTPSQEKVLSAKCEEMAIEIRKAKLKAQADRGLAAKNDRSNMPAPICHGEINPRVYVPPVVIEPGYLRAMGRRGISYGG